MKNWKRKDSIRKKRLWRRCRAACSDARRAARGNSGQGERRGTGNRPCGRNRSRTEGRRRRRLAVGADHRSHSVGLRRPPDPLRLPDGPDDRLVLYERLRKPRAGPHPRRHVRVLHRGPLHAAHRGDHPDHPPGGRRRRDGRHLQLAGHALAPEHPLLPGVHGLRRIVLRRVRDHDALVDGQ